MQIQPPPLPPIVVHWMNPDKPFYQDWDFWVSAGTMALAIVTSWLAIETRGMRKDSGKAAEAAKTSADAAAQMATTSARQLAASMQPVLLIEITSPVFLSDATTTQVSSTVKITNAGVSPVKINRLQGGLIGMPGPFAITDLPIPAGLTLLPRETYKTNVFLIAGPKGGQYQRARISAVVDCSDLVGVSSHQFQFDTEEGLRHRATM